MPTTADLRAHCAFDVTDPKAKDQVATVYDVIVVGAGPAGAEAAITASAHGLTVLLIDEGADAGGQIYRPPRPNLSKAQGPGRQLRARLGASGVTAVFGHRVWSVETGFRVETITSSGRSSFQASALIAATGALERFIPIPGWTMPGVFGLAAATVMLKSEGILPGRRTVVAGSGPLLALVAAEILTAGGDVAAVLDVHPRGRWAKAIPSLVANPLLTLRGAAWLGQIVGRGIPWLSGWTVREVTGRGEVETIIAGPIDDMGRTRGPERSFSADALCCGFGLIPGGDIPRLLGAAHDFVDGEGWVPRLDQVGRTSIAGLYACGDGARVLGAAAAPLGGKIAALSVARDLDRLADPWDPPLQRRFKSFARFGAAMTRLAVPPAGSVDWARPDTVVCRCENVTRATIVKAIDDGAETLDTLKSATRCGMGPCGGRICAEAVTGLLAHQTAKPRSSIQGASVRPPLRPLPLGLLAEGFTYDDLPIPAPSPL